MDSIPDIRPDPWLTWVVYLEWAISVVVAIAILWRERATLRLREQQRALDALAALDTLTDDRPTSGLAVNDLVVGDLVVSELAVSELAMSDLSPDDADADEAPTGNSGERRPLGRASPGSRTSPWLSGRRDLPTRGPAQPRRRDPGRPGR
ncbi:MAG: hypothetical protein IT305_07140 [Chloroflexi bacterium]|nr:hypothetical protein [Chloroflexota bacterium]